MILETFYNPLHFQVYQLTYLCTASVKSCINYTQIQRACACFFNTDLALVTKMHTYARSRPHLFDTIFIASSSYTDKI